MEQDFQSANNCANIPMALTQFEEINGLKFYILKNPDQQKTQIFSNSLSYVAGLSYADFQYFYEMPDELQQLIKSRLRTKLKATSIVCLGEEKSPGVFVRNNANTPTSKPVPDKNIDSLLDEDVFELPHSNGLSHRLGDD